MVFNNRAADPETHSHPLGLRSVECLKEMRGVWLAEPNAHIAYLERNGRLSIQLRCLGPDGPGLFTAFDAVHRLARFHEQIEQDLLQLDAVAHNPGQPAIQFQGYPDLLSVQFARYESRYVPSNVIEANRRSGGRDPLQQTTNPPKDFTGSRGLPQNFL